MNAKSKKFTPSEAMEEWKKQKLEASIGFRDSENKQFQVFFNADLTPQTFNHLPSEIYHIENKTINEIHIHQIDLKPIFQQMFSDHVVSVIDGLDRQYEHVANTMLLCDHYKENDYLNTAFDTIIKASSDFQADLKKYLQGLSSAISNNFKNNKPEYSPLPEEYNLKQLINTVDKYIQILFSYIFVSYSKNRSLFKDDPFIIKGITGIREWVLDLFEQTICCSYFDGKGNTLKTEGSLYGMLLLDKFQDTAKLEDYLFYDRRFNGLSDYLNFAKRCYIENNFKNSPLPKDIDKDTSLYAKYQNMFLQHYLEKCNKQNISLTLPNNPVDKNDFRWFLADNLYRILGDIDLLEIHAEQIHKLKTAPPEILQKITLIKD